MNPIAYVRPPDEAAAAAAVAEHEAQPIAGGTTLVDLMRLEVMRPSTVVDLTALPLAQIESTTAGLMLGALATNTAVAYHPAVTAGYPALAEALQSGASPQIRNMATVGGNLMQRTRCPYFRDTATACNKRQPGAGCSAIDGVTRSHAVLGTSPSCIATHPSDMCVALVALDAKVHVRGAAGAARVIPAADFHTLPDNHPDIESVLAPGELVVAVEVPASKLAARSRYVKVRDRASFAFALASAAVALELDGKTIRDARVALGGVATKPWRAREAEGVLAGRVVSLDAFQQAAVAAMKDAVPQRGNAFKIELARRTIVRALARAAGLA